MSETLLNEIRATKPEAPSALRERVRALSVQEPVREPFLDRLRFTWGWRRLVLAVPATVVVALVAAGVIGLSRDGTRDEVSAVGGGEAAATSSTLRALRPRTRRRRRPPLRRCPAARPAIVPPAARPAPALRGRAQPAGRRRRRALDRDQAGAADRARATAAPSPRSSTTRRRRASAPPRSRCASRPRRSRARWRAVPARDDRRPALRDRGSAAAGGQPADADRGRRSADRADPDAAREHDALGREPRRAPVTALERGATKLTGLRESLRSTRAEAAHVDRSTSR